MSRFKVVGGTDMGDKPEPRTVLDRLFRLPSGERTPVQPPVQDNGERVIWPMEEDELW